MNPTLDSQQKINKRSHNPSISVRLQQSEEGTLLPFIPDRSKRMNEKRIISPTRSRLFPGAPMPSFDEFHYSSFFSFSINNEPSDYTIEFYFCSVCMINQFMHTSAPFGYRRLRLISEMRTPGEQICTLIIRYPAK